MTMAVFLLTLGPTHIGLAQEPVASDSAAAPHSPQTVAEPPTKSLSEKPQTHVAVFALGGSPMDEDLSVGDFDVSGAELKPLYGGGIKVGVFPGFGRGVFGLEGELFGFGGSIQQRNAGGSRADGSLASVNSMVNLLVRYPGSVMQPYIGIGGGAALGYLSATSIQSGVVEVRGESDDVALAFQLIGGLRAYVSDRVYLFGEYKYFGTKYTWPSEGAGDPDTSFSFRAHIVAAGFGVSF